MSAQIEPNPSHDACLPGNSAVATAEQVTIRLYKAQNIALYEFPGRASP
jgi:hypothetical protein